MNITLQCEWCGTRLRRKLVYFIRNGPHAFCNKTCHGFARRQHKPLLQKRAEKANYDREYRAKNLQIIKQKKSVYFKRTYDPEKAKIVRAKNMPRHVEYCRRPEYRAKKHKYDIGYNARRNYGDFGESFVLLQQIESEVGKRLSDYEIRLQQGTLNKTQNRRKKLHENANRR